MQAPTLIIDEQLFQNIAMTADRTSSSKEVSEVGGFAVHFVWSGSPVGNLILQGSNDNVNFVAVQTQAVGGSAGQWLINIERQHYKYARLFYEFTSGSGTLNARMTAKNI
jgi:hypothetical protein